MGNLRVHQVAGEGVTGMPRAVPIVEAMAALVLVDHWMRQSAQNGTFRF